MRSQPSKKHLSGQKPSQLSVSQDQNGERSRNQSKANISINVNPSIQDAQHTLQDSNKLLIKASRGDTVKHTNERQPKGFNSLNTIEHGKVPHQQRTQFNTPLRGSTQKDQRVANSTSKLNSMTAVQLNQQQIEIEQKINDLSASFKEREDQQVKSEKIKVAVRVRPFLSKEVAKENVCYVAKTGKQIRVSDLTHTVEGAYDKVFPKEASQQDCYSFVSDCIPNLLQGINCTIFAYGQTGSGKTHTMFGDGFDAQIRQQKPELEQTIEMSLRSGIIPRCIGELFLKIKTSNLKYTIYCSFLQIYNEKLYDLLQDTYTKNPLQIREEKFQGIYVEGLSEYVVQDELDCLNLLKRGERNRIKRSTKMNIKSSRSHTLFQLLLETDNVDAKGMLKRAKLNLGDLAGSEKVNKDEEMKAKHMLELRNINLSLTTLGKVIQVLSQGGNTIPHVPFRESKLTRLLQDSIGGNCQTYLIATVSPIMESIEETISTLKFADRAKCVMQRVKKNEINAKDDALVQRLQREVQHLKELLQMKRKGGHPNDLSRQLYILKDENERLKQMAMSYEEIERMKQENKQMRLELQRLKVLASDGGSNYNGDLSPRSFSGAVGAIQRFGKDDVNSESISPTKHKKHESFGDNQAKKAYQHLSESDNDSIQDHFQNYKSELNFEVNLQEPKKHNHSKLNNQTEIQTHRDAGQQFQTPQNIVSSASKNDMSLLKQQKDKLQQVIHDQQSLTSPNKPRQMKAIRKRYKEGDLSDEGGIRQQEVNITLPAISDAQLSLQSQQFSKVEFSRKSSNQDFYRLNLSNQASVTLQGQHISQNPYSLNKSTVNPLVKSNETYLSDVTRSVNSIQKYPNRNISENRRSLHEFPQGSNGSAINHQNQQQNLVSISSEVNRSYQIGSQGMIGMTTQSSLYGVQTIHGTFEKDQSQSNFRNKSPLQTVVRIRGRYNQVVETKGSVLMTLDEEKRIIEKQQQLRRSNERLKMLESMEKSRQEKVQRELEQLMAEKVRREKEDLRKREIIKSRKYVNSNVGIVGDGLTNHSFNDLRKSSANHSLNQ